MIFARRCAVAGVAWYPVDTGMFVSSSFEKVIKVWDTNRAAPAVSFKVAEKILSLALPCAAARHVLIAAGGADRNIYICDMRTGSKVQTLAGHRDAVLCLAWSPGEEFVLASGGREGQICLWDIRKAKSCIALMQRYDGPGGAAGASTAHEGGVRGLLYVHHGRDLVSSGCDGRVCLWNTHTCSSLVVNFGSFVRPRRAQGGQAGYLCLPMAASRDGTVLYHPRGKDVAVCSLGTGRRISNLKGHFEDATCCAVHPGTESLFSAGLDTNILEWAQPNVLDPLGAAAAAGEEEGGLDLDVDDHGDAWSD